MQTIDLLGVSAGKIRAAIRMAEKNYNDEVACVSSVLATDMSFCYLLLSGPSCSGKTTTAAKIAGALSAAGRRVTVISIDDFYKEYDSLMRTSENGDDIDFESVSSIDLECLKNVADGLNAGDTVQLPKYDFTTNKRISFEVFTPKANDVYIFEGIQAMYPEIMQLFPASSTRRLFVTINSDLVASGVEIDKPTLRLVRRIVRDFKFRAASPTFTLSLWHNVRANEITNIMPNIRTQDIVLDTLLPYEEYILAGRLAALLPEVDESDPYAEQFRALYDRLLPLAASNVRANMVPKDSLLREFIGPNA